MVAEVAHPHVVEYEDLGIASSVKVSARFHVHSIQYSVGPKAVLRIQ